MKLLQYELTDWAFYKSGGKNAACGNWLRAHVFLDIHFTAWIGLSHLTYQTDPSKLEWMFYISEIIDINISPLWKIKYPKKIYLVNDLEQGKQDIDRFIEKVNSLKVYL